MKHCVNYLIIFLFCLSCKNDPGSEAKIILNDTLNIFNDHYDSLKSYKILAKYDSITFKVKNKVPQTKYINREIRNNERFVNQALIKLDSQLAFCNYQVTLRYVEIETPAKDTLHIYPHQIQLLDSNCYDLVKKLKDVDIKPKFIGTEIYPATCFYFFESDKIKLLVFHELKNDIQIVEMKKIQDYLDKHLSSFPLTKMND